MSQELINTRFFDDANLDSYYRFEGDYTDSKGTNDLSNKDTVLGTAYGKFGQGSYFDGTTHIQGDNYALAYTSDFTINLWCNPYGLGGSMIAPIISKVYYSSGEPAPYFIYADGKSHVNFSLGDGGINASSVCVSTKTLNINSWQMITCVWDSTSNRMFIYLNGIDVSGYRDENVPVLDNLGDTLRIGYDSFNDWYWNGCMDDISFFSRSLTSEEVQSIYGFSKNRYVSGIDGAAGTYPSADDGSLDKVAWKKLLPLFKKSFNGGQCFKNGVVSTYPLNTYEGQAGGYFGGVLAPNGDVQFIPNRATVGQKISSSGVVSTYSLIYTNINGAYFGGVLASNGDIHFVPGYFNSFEAIGQKISVDGTVSTYSLVYITEDTEPHYCGGVLAPNGDIHFVPNFAKVGQKISSSGVVSTYSLIYTAGSGYKGGVLAPNGNIYFVPNCAEIGEYIHINGSIHTYSLVYTAGTAYQGGVLAPNGDIHFVPCSATVGQKVSISGIVSTYSLVYTTTDAYVGGVLAPNGDIHFVPFSAEVGQKISSSGTVSTYSLAYARGNYCGGVLTKDGDIHFIQYNETEYGQKISTLSGIPFDHNVCLSPFFNKF